MKLPFRPLPLLCSSGVMSALYWGLNQADSRAIYAGWDKILHAAVFFVAWWLMRWSLRGSWWWVALLAAFGGASEEIHQLFMQGHQADWLDWYADLAGIFCALLVYGGGHLLWLFRANLEGLRASEQSSKGGEAPPPFRGQGGHAFDWRVALKFWRWEFYVVVLAGHERRALTRREQEVARWSLAFFFAVFSLSSFVLAGLVIYLITLALGR